ncbi:hypothetical protein R1sor_024194 [Riccia sorocarpa]|uniref:Reverse transcriptase domain-containing protein n=1 Tax=Riccia sorocarpa TaxID=122646 RepID=A0ABD3GPY2_9MARC
MLAAFWEDEQLTGAEKKGVIKLLAKNDEKCKLENWRPITLLGITYKLASKIIADRLKPLLPGLVSGQQTGFIPGRTIFDNILTLKLGEEWTVASGQNAIFLKLDFVKAYDHVRHGFLWETLHAMGFGPKIIRLIKGLMDNAEATVHHGGDFTEVFKMERGVRQGCRPPGPFLFSLTTEPLMRMLQEATKDNLIQGIKTSNFSQLVHSLFADDTGLCLQADENNFRSAKAIIEKFERISGAQLNVAKSLIIPLGMDLIPIWILETGCKVAVEGEVWTYLGTPVYCSETRADHDAKLLSHDFGPVYKWVQEVLDRIWWQFLWGHNGEGGHKKALVSWNRICNDKEEGGLGINTFKNQAHALKMRLISRILEGDKAEWAVVARELIELEFKQKKANRGKEKTANEILLLDNTSRMKTSVTMKNILQGWKASKKKLQLHIEENSLNNNIGIETLLGAGENLLGSYAGSWKALKRRCKTMGARVLGDLKGPVIARLQTADINHITGYLPDSGTGATGPPSAAATLLKMSVDNADEQGMNIEDPKIWRWEHELMAPKESWHRETSEWKVIINPAYNLREKMNASWGVSWDTEKWKMLWKRLWQANLYPRDKLWLWKNYTQQGVVYFRTGRHDEQFGSQVHTWKTRCKMIYEGQYKETPTYVIIQEAAHLTKSLAKKYTSISRSEKLKESIHILNLMRSAVATRNLRMSCSRQEDRQLEWSPPHQESSAPGDITQGRATDMSDAQQGRSPKERQARVETPSNALNMIEETEDGDPHEEELPRHTMAQELALLGFTAMEVEE